MTKQRCEWVGTDELMIQYHDEEWGVPVHDDTTLFEFLTLEGAQAGLSWSTVLKKREQYRYFFDNFDANKITQYDEHKIHALLNDSGIIRNRLKIASTIHNAHAFLAVQKEFGSFDSYIWQFVGHKPIRHTLVNLNEYPTKTKEAEKMSKDLLKRNFTFVGPTICYAFMQATGMVNDHQEKCFRKKELL